MGSSVMNVVQNVECAIHRAFFLVHNIGQRGFVCNIVLNLGFGWGNE